MASEGSRHSVAASNSDKSPNERITMVGEGKQNDESRHTKNVLCCGDAGLDSGGQSRTKTDSRQECVQISGDQNPASTQNRMSDTRGHIADNELSPHSLSPCKLSTGEEELLSSVSKLLVKVPFIPASDDRSQAGAQEMATTANGSQGRDLEQNNSATHVTSTISSDPETHSSERLSVDPFQTKSICPHPRLGPESHSETGSKFPIPDLNPDATSRLECGQVPTAAGDATGSPNNFRSVSVGDVSLLPLLPDTVRDASKECGQRDASEAYDQLFLEYYPEYKDKDKVYRVPSLFIGHCPYVSSWKSGDLQSDSNERFRLYGTTRTDVRGDIAEEIVASCIEDLLQFWVVDKYAAFVITSFQFENFCNKVNIPPSTDKNKYVKDPTNGPNTTAEHRDGEHDLLIVHYRYGIIFIQVKSCEETTDPNNTVKKAIEQTKADEEFFGANFDDLQTNVSVNSAIALPDKMKASLERDHKHTAKRIKDHYGNDGLGRCLFKEDLPCKGEDNVIQEEKKRNLLKWWQNITRDCRGFTSFVDYKCVVARYVGFKSTVQIPVTHPLANNAEAQEGRSLSRCVSEIGNRYMNIVLTPQQVYVLNSNLPRLIIRGQYGVGKTVLMILKVRELLKKLKDVCVISMSHSPLIYVLEQSIKHDMERIYCNKVRFETALDQIHLKTILERCSEDRCCVFIDEFPSFMSDNKELQKTIQDFPSGLLFWCVMSRERNETMSRGPKRLFSLFHKPELRFREAVMNKILRCPPSVQSFVPTVTKKHEKLIFRYPRNKLETNGPISNMTLHFHSLGLSTPQMGHLPVTSPESCLRWSDVVVLEPEPVQRKFYSHLVKLKIPLLRVSNIVQFSKTHLDQIKSGLIDMSAYTCSVLDFQNVQIVADIAGTDCAIYFKGGKEGQVVQLDFTVVAIAKFLHENGFINETVTKANKTLQIESNVKPRRWCDVVFLDRGEVAKPACYTFLENLGVPLVTPSSGDVMTRDAVLYTNRIYFEGFQRKETITFSDSEVRANVEDKTCMEGPRTIHVDHTDHEGLVESCGSCKYMLEQILHGLGMNTNKTLQSTPHKVFRPSTLEAAPNQPTNSLQPSDASGMSHNLLALAQSPRHDLSFADLIIIDDRENPRNAVTLFQTCGIPVVDKLGAVSLDAAEAFASDKKVLYIKRHLFQGLERKVVMIIRSRCQGVTPAMSNGILEDSTELTLTRCASQLIVISTEK